jgi:hypothetical protein
MNNKLIEISKGRVAIISFRLQHDSTKADEILKQYLEAVEKQNWEG